LTIDELYQSLSITDKVEQGRKVLLVVPSKDYDTLPVRLSLLLATCETATTWPKVDDPDKARDIIMQEVALCGAKVAIQVDCDLTRKLPWYRNGEASTGLVERVEDIRGPTFVNLHHHDEFSVKDSLGKVEELVELNKARNSPFVCVSNHGFIGGWIRQHNACKKAGVKALYAMEAYCQDYRGDDPELKKLNRKNFHLLLIANNKEGFKNIIKIHNDAQLNGFYYMPRANYEALKKYGKGIVATSACYAGEIPQALTEGDEAKALAAYERYKSFFDEFYIELSMIDMKEQVELNQKLVAFAKKVGAPMVVTLDSHYLYAEHSDTHNLLMLIRQHKTVNDAIENPEEVWQFKVGGLYCRDEQDLYKLFKEMHEGTEFTEEVFLEAVLNTRRIAVACDDIKLDPTFKLPKLFADADSELSIHARKNLNKMGLDGVVGYRERLERELDIIKKTGFADYFLVVEKIVNDTKAKFGDLSVGWGRGSAGGSLVSYVLHITDVDPIKYGLLFERFLDEGRKDDCPDIDLDFHPTVRGWVKEHIVKEFGEKYTCSIGTYQTYKTKAVILDVARVLGLDLYEAQAVTKKLDSLASFGNEDEEEQKIDQMELEEIPRFYPELGAYFEKYPEVLRHASIMRLQVKNMGKHAGGMIISNLDLTDEIPVYRDSSKQVVSAWAEGQATHELSSVGLVKFDILGLSNLAIIQDCLEYIHESKGIKLTKQQIDIDNKEAIKVSSRDDLKGIFQFEHPSTKTIADAVKMDSLADICAVTSLLRPGPRDMGMDMEYAARKNGTSEFKMLDCLKPILSETYGVLAYQEQVMLISQILSGFTPVESNQLRKLLVKEKNPEKLAKLRQKFIEGAKHRVEKGEITKEEVERWFDMCQSFAGYGFNKAHAVEYAAVSAAEFWLKFNFQTEYLAALINNSDTSGANGQQSEMVKYINYARGRGIKVLGPSVNFSGNHVRIQKDKIRLALSHVKNVGKSAALIEENAPYTDIEDFFNRVPKRSVNKRVFSSLALSGAFDELAPSWAGTATFEKRNAVMAVYYKLRKEEAPETMTEKQSNDQEETVLGICLTREPIRFKYKDMIKEKRWCPIEDAPHREATFVFGRVDGIVTKESKKGKPMKVVRLSDDLYELEFYVFEKGLMKFGNQVKKGMIVAMPLDKFADGGARFFNQMKDIVFVKK
jgi:DNA polymerase III subunit alpha